MNQKAILIGSIVAISAMFVFNLAARTGEASFLLGWAQAKMEKYDRAALYFRRAGKDSMSGSSLKDRANVALWAALVASGKYLDASTLLMKGNDYSEGEEKLRLDALRLYAFGISRAHTAIETTSETRRMQLESALNAFSGAFRISGDPEAAHNYEVVAKLLDEEKRQEEEKKAEEERKEEEKKKEEEEKKEEEKQEPQKNEEENQEPQKNEPSKEKPSNESPVPNQGNWTNGGDPQTLQSDPGGNKGANVTVPLSPTERQELEKALEWLAQLQEERERYVRPDGNRDSDGNIPDSLRELFFGDSFFDRLFPDSPSDGNGKSW